MNDKKSVEEKPCIDLQFAQELLIAGKLGLKQLKAMVERQKKKGVDVTDLEKILKRGKATERLGERTLKTALDKYKVAEKEV
jgi:DNA anti-recombination protein RmuC